MRCPKPDWSLLWPALRHAWTDTLHVSYDLFKVLVPLIILIKIFTVYGFIHYVAMPLEPLMRLTGLPPELGLAWATGLVINGYSGVLIFISLVPGLEPLTVAQTTTFAILLLMAHSLPMEGRIAQQCGISGMANSVIRLVMAIITAFLFSYFADVFNLFTEPSTMAFQPRVSPVGLSGWALNEARNLASIFCIIYVVMLGQRFLKYFRISDLLGYLLSPVLRLLGMGPAAATTVIVGFCMGLLYGSGIIIKEARSGALTQGEVFSAVTLMALSHALIEDTFLMMLIGASLWGILAMRLGMSLLAGILLNLFYVRLRQNRKVVTP